MLKSTVETQTDGVCGSPHEVCRGYTCILKDPFLYQDDKKIRKHNNRCVCTKQFFFIRKYFDRFLF